MNKDGHIELANFFIEVIKLWRIERDPFDLRRDRNSLRPRLRIARSISCSASLPSKIGAWASPTNFPVYFPWTLLKSSLMRRHSSNEAFHPNKQDNTETSIPPSRMSLSCKSRS